MNYLISQFLQLLDNDGNPLTGGKIFVYKRGLPELADVYLDFEGHLNTNPVILDSTGHATVIVDEGRFYDVIVQNRDGEQMWSMNNVTCIGYGEIIHREEVYHDDTLEGKGTEDEPLSVVGGGLSTVYTADPITGDGSEENPVTISDIMEIAHDDTMVHGYEGDNLVLGVNTSKFVVAGQKVDNAANADYATRAKNDSNGNDIASTYALKTEIPSTDNFATKTDLAGYYPITGGILNGKLSASGVGSASKDQAAVIYAKVTNTTANNQAGLGTNGSVWAGDYNSAVSQTIGVRRKVGDKRLSGRFQLYSDGNVSFQQISNNGTSDSITCQLQYGETTSGNNWGTMTFGNKTKHIAYKEDMETVLWENWATFISDEGDTATLSESIKNFDIIKFVTRETYGPDATYTAYNVVEVYNPAQQGDGYIVRAPNGYAHLTWTEANRQLYLETTGLPIFKIVGVNRKAGN